MIRLIFCTVAFLCLAFAHIGNMTRADVPSIAKTKSMAVIDATGTDPGVYFLRIQVDENGELSITRIDMAVSLNGNGQPDDPDEPDDEPDEPDDPGDEFSKAAVKQWAENTGDSDWRDTADTLAEAYRNFVTIAESISSEQLDGFRREIESQLLTRKDKTTEWASFRNKLDDALDGQSKSSYLDRMKTVVEALQEVSQ